MRTKSYQQLQRQIAADKRAAEGQRSLTVNGAVYLINANIRIEWLVRTDTVQRIVRPAQGRPWVTTYHRYPPKPTYFRHPSH